MAGWEGDGDNHCFDTLFTLGVVVMVMMMVMMVVVLIIIFIPTILSISQCFQNQFIRIIKISGLMWDW